MFCLVIGRVRKFVPESYALEAPLALNLILLNQRWVRKACKLSPIYSPSGPSCFFITPPTSLVGPPCPPLQQARIPPQFRFGRTLVHKLPQSPNPKNESLATTELEQP
jgi:hypothetical protein